jgi:hypothetical protein
VVSVRRYVQLEGVRSHLLEEEVVVLGAFGGPRLGGRKGRSSAAGRLLRL